MSATIEKRNLNKKQEFKNYLLDFLQEDYAFRQKVHQFTAVSTFATSY